MERFSLSSTQFYGTETARKLLRGRGLHLYLTKLREHFRRGATAYLVLAVALVPTLIAYMRVNRNVHAHDQAHFSERAQTAVDAIRDSLGQYEATLRGVCGLFEATETVRPHEWTRYINSIDLERRHPALRSIGYAPVIPRDKLDTFPALSSALLGTNLALFQVGNHPVIVPTIYVEQFGGANDRRFGWDSMTDPPRATALLDLFREKRPVISMPYVFSSDREPLAGCFTFFPIMGSGAATQTVQGVIFSSFTPGRLLRSLNKGQLDPALYVSIETAGQSPVRLAATETVQRFNDSRPPAKPLFTSTNTVRLANQSLIIRVASLPSFASRSESQLPLLVLCGGIIFSVLLFAIAWSQVSARHAAENMNRRLLASEEQLLKANRRLENKIYENRVAENLLEHERDLLRSLLDHSPDCIYFKDLQSRFIKCGKAVVERLRVKDLAQVIGRTDADFFDGDHAISALATEEHIIRTGVPVVGQVERETWLDGRETWVLTSKMPLRDKWGNIIGTFGASKDITALKKAEIELAREKDLLAVTLRSIGDGVITTDTEGRVVLFNKVAEQLTGWSYSEVAGMPLREVFHTTSTDRRDSDTELARRAMKSGEIVARESGSILVARDGTERQISETVAPIVDPGGRTIGAVLVFRDVTEKLKTEAELLRANKLESIGVLAGGIAHDFNNILTVILGNISLARMLTDGVPPQLGNVLNEAEKASLRARDLTQRLLTFAKGGLPIKKAIAPGPLLRDCTKAVLQGTEINYHFFIADDLWSVNADEGQLAQVFHNLVLYARNSVGENPAIDVYASNQDIASDPLLFLKPGQYVRISIRDHGAGLAPEQLNKIFDPYFTSKKQGNGLELATAYSIVRKHDGQIRVESISGQGTVFHVYLPATKQPVLSLAPNAAPAAPVVHQGRVLVMDDEAAIRQLASMLLKKIGYTPVLAADGAEAIAKYEEAQRDGQPFTAVIMDLTIPNGMGGAEALRRLRTVDPDIKAIVSSGYSNDPVMANFREYGFSGVVPKPYSAGDLASALGELHSCEVAA